MNNELAVIILAAGKGTRMKSATPKVLHGIAGRSMIGHVLHAVQALKPARTLVVVGYGAAEVEARVAAEFKHVEFVHQTAQNGTGHAVLACEGALKNFSGNVLVVYGDIMLNICPHTLPALLAAAAKNAKGLTMLSATLADPTGFGRLFKKSGSWVNVEEKDCTPAQRKIKTANPCIYALPAKALWPLLHKLKPHNAQKELYLTDIIELAAKAKLKVNVLPVEATRALVGINTREELAAMEAELQAQLRKTHMLNGVTLLDPASVYFCVDTQIANDVVIEPHVVFGPEVKVEGGVIIRGFSHLQGCTIKTGARVGPFARIRPGSTVGKNARIGNFVELKNATVGEDTAAGHLSYLGDVDIGARTNIGAGTIVANYKHHTKQKWRSKIGSNVSTGSHTTLVAPAGLGDNSVTGAGTVVRSDVEPGALAVAKPHILIKKNYIK